MKAPLDRWIPQKSAFLVFAGFVFLASVFAVTTEVFAVDPKHMSDDMLIEYLRKRSIDPTVKERKELESLVRSLHKS